MIIQVSEFPRHLSGTLEGYINALKSARERMRAELLFQESLDFKPLPHQIEVAKRVIYDMDSRAILADEVGLGKTIEAGIILKEKLLRKEIETALILTPASLSIQWHNEMREKFNLNFTLALKPDDFRKDLVISSIQRARRVPYRDVILGRRWDMLIVDEAHHVRNPRTQNYSLVRSINSKFVLLLTATPVSNSLKEIYYLADIVRPGIFGTYREFEAKYFSDRKGIDAMNTDTLRDTLRRIMVRNRRRDVFVDLTTRVVRTHIARQSSGERDLYDMVLDFLRSEENKLRVISYAKAATSSPRTVARMAWKALERESSLNTRRTLLEIYRMGMDAEFSKIELLGKIAESVESGVIFTTYLETQREIGDYLRDLGFPVFLYHGGMNQVEKARTIEYFRKEGGFLVATDSGGEGLNLQFTNTLVNFDLPWNPMRVEQRIGRVHRIGQLRDVYVVNLAYMDTIEEHVLNILDRKIGLFRSVIGEVDAILGSLERNFESIIAEIIMKARNREELNHEFEKLGARVEEMKSSYERMSQVNDEIFSNFDLSVVGGV